MEQEKIRQNLQDAGCCEEDIQKILSAMDRGSRRELEALIEGHRRQLLDQYHHSKACIDCIDYFTYQLQRSWEGQK